MVVKEIPSAVVAKSAARRPSCLGTQHTKSVTSANVCHTSRRALIAGLLLSVDVDALQVLNVSRSHGSSFQSILSSQPPVAHCQHTDAKRPPNNKILFLY